MGRPALNLEGVKFGDWSVLSRSDIRNGKYVQWLCECKCGTQRLFKSSVIKREGSSMCSPCANKKNGELNRREIGWKTPTYHTWSNMKARCLNEKSPSYDYYGGRGIKVCDRWMSFDNFFSDMGERPQNKTLDRIDTDGNYCPENCRWATKLEQANNTRSNRRIKYGGYNLTIAEWSRRTGINRVVIRSRIDFSGWTVGKALGYDN